MTLAELSQTLLSRNERLRILLDHQLFSDEVIVGSVIFRSCFRVRRRLKRSFEMIAAVNKSVAVPVGEICQHIFVRMISKVYDIRLLYYLAPNYRYIRI